VGGEYEAIRVANLTITPGITPEGRGKRGREWRTSRSECVTSDISKARKIPVVTFTRINGE